MEPRLQWQICADAPGAGRLFCGDNLCWMRSLPDESVHLIYADPPFFSGKHYRQRQGHFTDCWPGGLQAYLPWLTERLAEMRRLLVPGGTLYVHLDWHVVHYVKVALDQLFGRENFLNEIIWTYSAGGRSQRFWARKHDTILYYVKGPGWTFNAEAVRVPYASGMTRWSYSRGNMQGKPLPQGKVPEDVFSDCQLNTMAKERTGYPTQKPLSLLRRLILASSHPGEVVADFFAGSGTTLVAAADCARQWLGADRAAGACALAYQRLHHHARIERGETYQWGADENWRDPLAQLVQLPTSWRLYLGRPTDDREQGHTVYVAPQYQEEDWRAALGRGLLGFSSQLVRVCPYPPDELTAATSGAGNARLHWGPHACLEPVPGGWQVSPPPPAPGRWWVRDDAGGFYEMVGSVLQGNDSAGGNCKVSCLVVDHQGAGAVRCCRL